jgi:hypothetical protein
MSQIGAASFSGPAAVYFKACVRKTCLTSTNFSPFIRRQLARKGFARPLNKTLRTTAAAWVGAMLYQGTRPGKSFRPNIPARSSTGSCFAELDRIPLKMDSPLIFVTSYSIVFINFHY